MVHSSFDAAAAAQFGCSGCSRLTYVVWRCKEATASQLNGERWRLHFVLNYAHTLSSEWALVCWALCLYFCAQSSNKLFVWNLILLFPVLVWITCFSWVKLLFPWPPYSRWRSRFALNFVSKRCWRNFSNDCNFNYYVHSVHSRANALRRRRRSAYLFKIEHLIDFYPVLKGLFVQCLFWKPVEISTSIL